MLRSAVVAAAPATPAVLTLALLLARRRRRRRRRQPLVERRRSAEAPPGAVPHGGASPGAEVLRRADGTAYAVRRASSDVPLSPFTAAASLPPFSGNDSAADIRLRPAPAAGCRGGGPATGATAAAAAPAAADVPRLLLLQRGGPSSMAGPAQEALGPHTPELGQDCSSAQFTCSSAACGASPSSVLQPSAVAAAVALVLKQKALGGGGGCGGGGRVPGDAAAAAAALPPEVSAHVAVHDAAAAAAAAAAARQGGAPSSSSHELLRVDTLPPELRRLVVDPSEVQFLLGRGGQPVLLGRGASGRVVKARLRGEEVAAKVIDIGSSPEAQQAFLLEASRLHSLRHPNLVSLFGLLIKGAQGCLLQEYCEGHDLFAALPAPAGGAGASGRALSWRRRGKRVAYDCAKALNYLHAQGVLHCDIKSSNVLLDGCGTAKLADIGLSRCLGHSALAATEQERALRCGAPAPLPGTFAFMAPELLLGSEPTEASDVYSFGVLLWEIITGERPQRGCLRMPRVPQECSQEACDLFLDCVSQDPAGRPTALDLLLRLGRLRRARSEELPPGGPALPAAPGGLQRRRSTAV